ncbi:MAG: hypothetical protein ACE149_16585 [Armatimonadota bacterium]
MRTENVPQNAGDGDVKETATAGTSESPVAAAAAAPATPKRVGKLTALMALEEPARTEALEKAVTAGLTVYLRSTTGGEVRWRYGDHVLVVPETPKPFAAAHAIHLLFYASDKIEEVEG